MYNVIYCCARDNRAKTKSRETPLSSLLLPLHWTRATRSRRSEPCSLQNDRGIVYTGTATWSRGDLVTTSVVQGRFSIRRGQVFRSWGLGHWHEAFVTNKTRLICVFKMYFKVW